MIYLKEFSLVSENTENIILSEEKRTYFHNQYPFRIFPKKEFKDIKFSDVTILYGGTGSGKSTILNIIANKLNSDGSFGAHGEMQMKYLDNCNFETSMEYFEEVKIIRSDDVFDYISNIRRINNRGFSQREKLFREYFDNKDKTIDDMNDYQNLKNSIDEEQDIAKHEKEKLENKINEQKQMINEQTEDINFRKAFISKPLINTLYKVERNEDSYVKQKKGCNFESICSYKRWRRETYGIFMSVHGRVL